MGDVVLIPGDLVGNVGGVVLIPGDLVGNVGDVVLILFHPIGNRLRRTMKLPGNLGNGLMMK